METVKPLFSFTINGIAFGITSSIVVQWVIIAIVTILCILLTRNLKKVPGKKQSIAEMIVEAVNNLVKGNMGEKYTDLAPYVGTLILFLLLMNLAGLVGVEPPTTDYSVSLGMALTTFVVIQSYTIKKIGLGHYFKAYLAPMPFMLPMNILERVLLPVSLSLRLFGNMTAAAVIMALIYKGLGGISPFAQIGIPIPLHAYFDVFDGTLQMVVFMMLSIINLKVIVEH